MESKRRAFLKRNRAREIVHRTARGAKKKYLRAGLELLQKPPRFTQANRRRSRLKSRDSKASAAVRRTELDSDIGLTLIDQIRTFSEIQENDRLSKNGPPRN